VRVRTPGILLLDLLQTAFFTSVVCVREIAVALNFELPCVVMNLATSISLASYLAVFQVSEQAARAGAGGAAGERRRREEEEEEEEEEEGGRRRRREELFLTSPPINTKQRSTANCLLRCSYLHHSLFSSTTAISIKQLN